MAGAEYAYCPKCDDRRELVPETYKDPSSSDGVGLVLICHSCGNGMVYDSREDYLEAERDKLEHFEDCDHEATRDDRCDYCGLPNKYWDNPAEVIDDAAFEEVEES